MISYVNQALSTLLNSFARAPSRRANRRTHSLQNAAAFGCLVQGQVERGLVAIEELTLVTLYGNAAQPGRWLAGYSAERVPWGVAWGGVQRQRFLKDMSMPPKMGARSACLDLQDPAVVELAFQLKELLGQYRSQRLSAVQNRLELPKLWAGFERMAAHRIKGGGPELSAACRQRRRSSRQLLRTARHNHRGLVLLPLDWVSHRWRDIACVFADIGRFRKRQLFRLRDPHLDLIGYRGAVEFDFFSSRFRRDGF